MNNLIRFKDLRGKGENLSIQQIVKEGCLVCGCEDRFLIGPRGGLSQMFKCDNCGTEYVVYPTGKVEIIKNNGG